MKFSEDKLKKMNRDELFNFAKIIGVKCSAKASKEEIMGLLLGLKIEKNEEKATKKAEVKSAKAVEEKPIAKKRGRPSKAEKAAKAETKPANTVEEKPVAKKRGRPSKAEKAAKTEVKPVKAIEEKPVA
ncbi:MAG: hypothetical protein II567_09940, partial [Candidatus Riflebacteria bacterium]|nr:hypothetical protein [Candidatus Riflebacteria bacterium]